MTTIIIQNSNSLSDIIEQFRSENNLTCQAILNQLQDSIETYKDYRSK